MRNNALIGLLLVLVLSVFIVGTVSAQYVIVEWRPEPSGFLESPTSISSAGRFTSPVDDYIHASYWADVDINKWFGFVSFDDHYYASLGYARKIGGIYIAAYYGGNLFQNYAQSEWAEEDINWNTKRTLRRYNQGFNFSGVDINDNRFALLIGFGIMGIRLSYASTHDSFSKEDLIIDVVYYKSFSKALGWIIPQIQWGLTRPLMSRGIQPTVTFDLGFYRNFERGDAYNDLDWGTAGDDVRYSNNVTVPRLSLGLGGFTFYYGDDFNAGFDLDYTMLFGIYRNDYSYSDGVKLKTKTIKGLNLGFVSLVNFLYENSYFSNDIAPSINVSYTGNDRLGLSAKLSLPIGLVSYEEAKMDIKDEGGGLWKNGIDFSAFLFSFTPALRLGLQYKIVPGRLTLNAGGVIKAATITFMTFEETNYSLGSKDPGTPVVKGKAVFHGEIPSSPFSSRIIPYTSSSDFATGLYAGFNFNMSDNFVLESVSGVNNSNEANLFGAGGESLGLFTKILATLKF